MIGVQANTLKKQIEDFLDKEETMWCQCSRVRDDMSRAYTRPTRSTRCIPEIAVSLALSLSRLYNILFELYFYLDENNLVTVQKSNHFTLLMNIYI